MYYMQNKHNILNMKDLHVCVRARGCHSHGASASVRHWHGAARGYTPVWVRACARARQSAQVSKGQWLRGATAKWLESESSNKQPEQCHESDSESESDGDAAALAIANGSKTLGTMDA